MGLTLFGPTSILPTVAEAGIDPFIGDIVAVGYNFCPRGWVSAEGQILPISQFTPLFALIGITYGGNGTSTFALPDLRGRVAMGQGAGPGLTQRPQGQIFGVEGQLLTSNELPSHNHVVNANNLDGNLPGPGGKVLAAAPPSGVGSETIYSDQGPNVTMSPTMIATAGQSQAFNVEDPSQVMRFCIATEGVFPQRP
ncbi:phage tail protein [Roseovarius sp. MBR-51]